MACRPELPQDACAELDRIKNEQQLRSKKAAILYIMREAGCDV